MTEYFQVAEKIVLPSAEDLKAEKTHENLQKGIEGFTPDKLKQVKTKEPASGAECKWLNQFQMTRSLVLCLQSIITSFNV